jgi:hypothetical protein
MLSPPDQEIRIQVAEADGLTELLGIMETWPCNLESVCLAFRKAISMRESSAYVPDHSRLIRAALYVMEDLELAREAIRETEKFIEGGLFDRYGRAAAYLELAKFYAGRNEGFPLDKVEASRLLRLAAPLVAKRETLELLVELAGYSYSLDCPDLARELVEIVLNTCDQKNKAQLKKFGLSALKNIR